jgi:hypothetical protein
MFTQTDVYIIIILSTLVVLGVFIEYLVDKNQRALSRKELAEYKKYLQGPLDPRD